MKKFALLVLTALLFAGCNNMLTNPDAFSVEEASVSMDISQLKARVATDGAVITSTLDFVGDEPKHSPFEKTQTINGSTINYTIKGLPVGSSVQFKLSVMKNGIVIFEGTSDKTTVKSKTDLKISLDKQSNWVVYSNYDELENKYNCYSLDINFTQLNTQTFDSNSSSLIKLPFMANGREVYADIKQYCTDDKNNAYFIADESQNLKLYRYNLISKQITLLASPISNFPLCYDAGNDNLLIISSSGSGYYAIPNASTMTEPLDENPCQEPNLYPDGFTYDSDAIFSFYNNEIYWAEKTETSGYKIKKASLVSEQTKNITLYDYDTDLDKLIGNIVDTIKSSFYPDKFEENKYFFSGEISDIAVTKEGVFALLNNNVTSASYDGAARGGVIKMNHDLTTATIYGWTETKQVLSKKKSDGTIEKARITYLPKSINNGFYGPTKILAVKPKKLIFSDIGYWYYINDEGNVNNVTKATHNLVVFDLESCTWGSAETNLNEEESGDWSLYANYASDYTIIETWE